MLLSNISGIPNLAQRSARARASARARVRSRARARSRARERERERERWGIVKQAGMQCESANSVARAPGARIRGLRAVVF